MSNDDVAAQHMVDVTVANSTTTIVKMRRSLNHA